MNRSKKVFDEYAESYDQEFSETKLGILYRKRIHQYFYRYWSSGKRILELNCGTGEDAVLLAHLGNNVVATDISPRMLAAAKSKSMNYEKSNLLEFREISLNELEKLSNSEYDGVLSNFGGLNCIPDIDSVSRNLKKIVRPEGIVMLCIMGRYVIWEWIWYSVKLRFRTAFRRIFGHTAWRGVDIYYPKSQYVVASMKQSGFELVEGECLGILLPPSYVSHIVERNFWFFSRLDRLERYISKIMCLKNFSDHYFLVFRRINDNE